MLRWRILLGALLIAALVALFWGDALTAPSPLLIVVATVVALAAAQEFIALVARGGWQPMPSVIYGGTLLVMASNAVPILLWPVGDDRPLERLAWPLLAFAVATMAAFVGEISRYRQPGRAIVHAALAVLAVAYVGVLFSFAIQLRYLGGVAPGMTYLVAMIATVKFADIGAYTVGRLIGRHKMAPLVSPGKTWEGAAGAVVFACLGAWLTLVQVPNWMRRSDLGPADATFVVLFGILVAVAGMLGDLAESLLKRDMGAKDSSTWMPGFGGILDLVDSILFAAPVAYLLCWWGLIPH